MHASRRLTALLIGAVVMTGCATPDADEITPAPEAIGEPEAPETIEAATGGIDSRPHLHDYWQGRERVLLFDAEVTFDILGESTFMNAFTRQDLALGGARLELPEGHTVYEGTGEMHVTATWSDPTITSLSVGIKTPTEPETRETYQTLEPLTNGETHVRAVAPEETDMPHEGTSRWGFYFSATGPGDVAQGQAHVTIAIVRMHDVQLFPGHPATYVDGDHYVLADKTFTYEQASALNLAREAVLDQSRQVLRLDAAVPMGTRVLTLDVTLDTDSGTASLLEHNGMELIYRGADGARHRTQAYAQEGALFRFALPVTDSQADSPYSDDSIWRLGPTLKQQVAGIREMTCPLCVSADVKGHARVMAWAEAPEGVMVLQPESV